MTTAPPTTKLSKTTFYGKTWVPWALMITMSTLGLFSVPFGILSWIGLIKDTYGHPRPDSGLPMVAVGSFMLLAAVGALRDILAARNPLLEIYQDGILLRKGRHPFFAHWADYRGARITGTLGTYMLTLQGTFLHTKNQKQKPFGAIQYRQDRFIDPLQTIAASIEHFQHNPAARGQLPIRPSSHFPIMPASDPRR